MNARVWTEIKIDKRDRRRCGKTCKWLEYDDDPLGEWAYCYLGCCTLFVSGRSPLRYSKCLSREVRP